MKKDYVVPPFKIRMVEPLKSITRQQRIERLEEAGYNPFSLRSEDVYIDLLTDSGTGAMSQRQWAAMLEGDESYAGSRSFYALEKTVREITGYEYVIPVHQGRGAEQVLLPLLVPRKGMYFISNTHFDTTRAHVELAGARAIDLPLPASKDSERYHPFKGNFDLEQLERVISEKGKENIAGIIMTITNNSVGGQPVSLENMKAVRRIADASGITVLIDGARYAENAYFIAQRERKNASISAILKETFSYGDVLLMSSKKDGLVNIGGLIAIRKDESLYQRCRTAVVPKEGFPTYGGLSGRDMAALSVGLREAIEEDYLAHRIDEVRYLGDRLRDAGIPIQYPTGGHAVFVDCGKIAAHIPYDQFPAQAVVNALYVEGGVRGVEIGSFMLGRDPDTNKNIRSPKEFMRLAIPRRTYTYSHLDHVADALIAVSKRAHELSGLEFTYEPPILRHFTARLRPVSERNR
ncbi:MAG: tryptophanase [Acholeplasmataceae bacterium]